MHLTETLQTLLEYIIKYFQDDCELSVHKSTPVEEKTENILSSELTGSAIAISGEQTDFTLYCAFSQGLIRYFHKLYLMEESDEVDAETAYGLASEVVNTIAGNITPLLSEGQDDIVEITTPIHPDDIKQRIPRESVFPGAVLDTSEGECSLFILE